MTFRARVTLNVRWNAVSQVLKLSHYFLISIILARLLQPEDFGLLGMATVFIGLVAVFNDFGFGSAIIQKGDIDHKTLTSVFWASLGVGVLAMSMTILSAPWIALFYRQEKIKFLLYLLSISFPIGALGQVQLSLLIKRIDFKKIAIIEVVSSVVGGAVAIVMAFMNKGVWCLAMQIIVTSGTSTALLWLTNSWLPGMNFNLASLREVFVYSSGLFGFNFVNYFSRNSDYILIGKFLGAEPLGQYTFAYRLMQFPLQNIAGVVNRVLFPTLAQVKDNDEQFRNGFVHASQLIASVTFPMMVGVLCLAPEMTVVIFGAKWIPAIPIIQILSMVGLIQSVGGIVGNIYTAKGKTDWLFYWGIFSSIIVVSGIVFGLRWGILGVGLGYAFTSLLLVYPNFAIPFRFIGQGFIDYLWSLKSPIFLAGLMGMIIFFSSSLQRTAGLHQLVILASNILIGAVIYIVGIILFDRKLFVELLNAIFGKYALKIVSYLNI